mmetsp:Transcript_12566/g.35497  ORF Transcript_12566/g.35497 Transcript_12566/m.35497 type:complete len:235 (-) Transcript_12566:594-1298(-)
MGEDITKVVVGYWDIRGLAAPLRMVLEYVGAEYDNVTYKTLGEPGNWDVSDWFGKKPALLEKNALMNLPYVIDGDMVVTQSNACLLYLGRKYGLNGKTEKEISKNDQCLCQVMDLRNDAVFLFYAPADRFHADKEKYFTSSLARHLKKMDSWLTMNGTDFLAGDTPTVCDFHFFELLDQHEAFAKFLDKRSPLEKFEQLEAYYKRFRALPQLEKYFVSDMHKLPINNKMAQFHG